LCDIHGNRELLCRDPDIASMSPMPLAPRPMPHALQTTNDITSIDHTPYLGLRKGSRIEKREPVEKFRRVPKRSARFR
jgi:hypothetical protein